MAWISAVFFCLGAADTLLGDRLGLGSAFRQGFAAVVDLLLLMTGFMALAPWLGTHLAPVITPVFSAVGCDPSLFASLFLSCDAGGAVLAAQIAQEPSAGLYNGFDRGGLSRFHDQRYDSAGAGSADRHQTSRRRSLDCFSAFWSCRWAACSPGRCAASPCRFCCTTPGLFWQ